MQEKDFIAKLEQFLKVIAQQQVMINELNEVVRKLESTNLFQSESIKALEEQVHILKQGKNSQNSSKPPSTDFNVKRSLRKPGKNKSGGQPGHKGNTLEISSLPDQIIRHDACFCSKCGNDLENVAGRLVDKRQVIDIPTCIPTYSEHQIFARQCNCGHDNEGSFPGHLKAAIQYGPSVESLVVYLSVRQYIPYNRIAEYLRHSYNLPVSEGTIANILTRFAQKATLPYEKIKANLLASAVVGSDETGVKVNGEKAWMHTWQDQSNTYIICHPSRGSKAIEEKFPNGFPNSILVSDAWAAQLKTPAAGHQLCLAHLQRDLKYFIETLKNPWAEKVDKLFAQTLQAKRDNLFGADISNSFQIKLETLLSEELRLPNKINAFKKRLIKNKDSLFKFLLDPTIPSDNNGSERAIRNLKVKQKISGQFKSRQGADCFAIIRSIIDTIIKRGLDIFTELEQIAIYYPE